MAGSSWTRHRRLPSLTTPTAKATLVSSTSPSGIIVMMPATAPATASEKAPFAYASWLTVSRMATGTITQLMRRRKRLMPAMSSEWARLNTLASPSSWAAYERRPTRVAVNAPEPLTTKLPESSWSPGFLVTGSISPVSSDSSTSMPGPSVTSPSTMTRSPGPMRIQSPRTMSCGRSAASAPSRITRTGSSPSTARRSNVRLARSSWITPMPVFATMTRPNRASCGCPVTSTTAARAPTMALNLVSTFARTMSGTGLLVRLPVSFVSPAATRSATCALVSPLCCRWVSTRPPIGRLSTSSSHPAGRPDEWALGDLTGGAGSGRPGGWDRAVRGSAR